MTSLFPTALTWKHCLPVSILCHAIALATLWALPQKTQSFQPIADYPEEFVSLAQDMLPPIFLDEPVAQDIPDPDFDPFEQPELPDLRPTNLFFEETLQARSDESAQQAPSQPDPIAIKQDTRDTPAPPKAETPGTPEQAQTASANEGGTSPGTATGSGAPTAAEPTSGPSGHASALGNGQDSPAIDENAIWKAYAASLNAHFKKFKHYPVIAKKRRLTGTVLIQITLDRTGAVLDASVLQSSGQAILDEAALASAKDASPAPPFPETLSAQTRKIEIPYSYALK